MEGLEPSIPILKVWCLTAWLHSDIIPAVTAHPVKWIHLNFTKWWARVVPTHLLPKKANLQSAAVADLLLIHIKFIAFLYLQAAFTLDVNGSGSVYSRKD